MPASARLAVVFRERFQEKDTFYPLDEFPRGVKLFFGNLKVEGDHFYFVVTQHPSDWAALLYYYRSRDMHVLFLDAFWFEHSLSSQEELEAFLQKVRCAISTGRFTVVFERQNWKNIQMLCDGNPVNCIFCSQRS